MTTNSSVKDKICLITGAANGIGFAIATNFLQNQAFGVTIADIDAVKGEEALKLLQTEFGPNRVIFVKVDVTKTKDLKNAFETTVNKFNGIDILVNNAGLLNEALWMKEIEINLIAVINSTKMALNYLKAGGLIINMSSILGLKTAGCFPIYSATKHAIVAFTSSTALMPPNKKLGVKFVTVCPGLTETALGLNCYKDEPLDMIEYIQKGMQTLPLQKTKHVAEGIEKIIGKAISGSVWVCEGGNEPYPIEQDQLILDECDNIS